MYNKKGFDNVSYRQVPKEIYYLKENKIAITILFLFFVGLFQYFYWATNSYEAEAQITFNDYILPDVKTIPANSGMAEIFSKSVSLSRVNRIVNSSKMYDYLIKKYNLTERYKIENGIDKEFALRNKISKYVRFGLVNFPGNSNRIFIKVISPDDPVLCAEMANDIAGKIREENKLMILKDIDRKQQLNKTAADQLYQKYSRLIDDLKGILSKFETVSVKQDLANKEKARDISSQFEETLTELKTEVDVLKDFENINNQVSIAKENISLPDIDILQPALVNNNGTNLSQSIFIPVSIFCSALISIFITVFTLQIKERYAAWF